MLCNGGTCKVHRCKLEDIENLSSIYSDYVPVGSVEFIEQFSIRFSIELRASNTYPIEIRDYLGRDIWETTLGEAKLYTYPVFIKPEAMKKFTGFVYGIDTPEQDFLDAPDSTKVYCSLPIEFVSEYRYYINGNTILGFGRYDQSETENAPEPDLSIVNECIERLNLGRPFSLDLGVLSNGNTVLVEYHEFYALGLYDKALSPEVYSNLLYDSWKSLS